MFYLVKMKCQLSLIISRSTMIARTCHSARNPHAILNWQAGLTNLFGCHAISKQPHQLKKVVNIKRFHWWQTMKKQWKTHQNQICRSTRQLHATKIPRIQASENQLVILNGTLVWHRPNEKWFKQTSIWVKCTMAVLKTSLSKAKAC